MGVNPPHSVTDTKRPKKAICAEISAEAYELLARTAKVNGQTKTSIIEEALYYYCVPEEAPCKYEGLPSWSRPIDSIRYLFPFDS